MSVERYKRSDGDSTPRYRPDAGSDGDELHGVAEAIASYMCAPDPAVMRQLIREWLGSATIKELPPEKMLVRFKEHVRDAGGLTAERLVGHDARTRELVLMCIEEYYSRK